LGIVHFFLETFFLLLVGWKEGRERQRKEGIHKENQENTRKHIHTHTHVIAIIKGRRIKTLKQRGDFRS
jgi:hypothetical protein